MELTVQDLPSVSQKMTKTTTRNGRVTNQVQPPKDSRITIFLIVLSLSIDPSSFLNLVQIDMYVR